MCVLMCVWRVCLKEKVCSMRGGAVPMRPILSSVSSTVVSALIITPSTRFVNSRPIMREKDRKNMRYLRTHTVCCVVCSECCVVLCCVVLCCAVM